MDAEDAVKAATLWVRTVWGLTVFFSVLMMPPVIALAGAVLVYRAITGALSCG